jgi:hypothetical protein
MEDLAANLIEDAVKIAEDMGYAEPDSTDSSAGHVGIAGLIIGSGVWFLVLAPVDLDNDTARLVVKVGDVALKDRDLGLESHGA